MSDTKKLIKEIEFKMRFVSSDTNKHKFFCRIINRLEYLENQLEQTNSKRMRCE